MLFSVTNQRRPHRNKGLILHTTSNNISAGAFILLCNPAWSRVYTEVSHSEILKSIEASDIENVSHVDSLPWLSEPVKATFIRLTGFDPARLQFADEEAQHHALNAAREVERALFVADEIEQIDGTPAIEYAGGWMAARDALAGAHKVTLSNEEIIIVASRYSNAIFGQGFELIVDGKPRPYLNGFTKRMALGNTYVA